MATYTENYNLLKPEDADFYSVEDFNDNMDTIDTLMAENESVMTSIDEKIGNPGDTGTDTLFGAMQNGGGSVIKSIQHFIAYGTGHETDAFDVGSIDTSKTIVIVERLSGSSEHYTSVSYSLSETELSVTLSSDSTDAYSVGFWVIEFN